MFGRCQQMFDSNSVANSWDTQYYIKKLDFILYFLFLFHIKSSVYRDDFVDVAPPNPPQLTVAIMTICVELHGKYLLNHDCIALP